MRYNTWCQQFTMSGKQSLPLQFITEVSCEIENHIFDALQQQQAVGQQADAQASLPGFGEHRVFAARYVKGLPRLLQGLKHNSWISV